MPSTAASKNPFSTKFTALLIVSVALEITNEPAVNSISPVRLHVLQATVRAPLVGSTSPFLLTLLVLLVRGKKRTY